MPQFNRQGERTASCTSYKKVIFMSEYASRGVGGTALGLAAGALGLNLLNGNLGNLFNGGCGMYSNGNSCCSENALVNRYESGLNSRIAQLETEVKLRDANTYTDKKTLELYGYIDGRLRNVESQICNQAVTNAQVAANLSCQQNAINTLMSLTKTVVPITNICPEPMPLYNSFTVPTTTTTT